jgi:hypothetical protein
LLVASLGLFSLLNFLIIPAATRTWAASRAIAKVSKVAALTLLNFLRTLSRGRLLLPVQDRHFIPEAKTIFRNDRRDANFSLETVIIFYGR